jgi:plasmid stabilization system protein ParE
MNIVWTPQATDSYMDNVDYLRIHWDEEVIENFIAKVESVFDVIALMPYAFPAPGQDKTVRKCILIKQISLYYRVRTQHIELITFWHNRKNPQRLTLKIH